MARTGKQFKHFPLIYISPKRAWGNPTLGKSRLPVFKIWELVSNHAMEELLEENPALTLGEINSVMEFVDWCMSIGLMEERKGRLAYDKDALYRVATMECPPKGSLCLYCTGFVSRASPAWTEVKDRYNDEAKTGIAHGACVQAILLDEPAPIANVLI